MPSKGVLVGVGAVVLTGGAAAGYFGALAMAYSATVVAAGALSIVGGIVAPCKRARYAIRGTINFANGANSTMTVNLGGGASCEVTVGAPTYAFTGLEPGQYIVSVQGIAQHNLDPAEQTVRIDAADRSGIDFTVTFVPDAEVDWPITKSITYGDALKAIDLNASLVRRDNRQVIPATAKYTYDSGKPFNNGDRKVKHGTKLNPGRVLPAGKHTLQVNFSVPDGTLCRLPEPKQVTLTVAQATPVVDFTTDWVNKEYGTDPKQETVIRSATFKGEPVEGTCEFSGTDLQPGQHELTVKFKPKDTQNYKNVSGKVKVDIKKRQLRIEWETPAAINYGKPLNRDQLNAVLDPSISTQISYQPAGGTVLKGGKQTLKANYPLPSRLQDLYLTPKEKTVTLRVNPVTPLLTAKATEIESNPGPLTALHITAHATFNGVTVDGNLTYSPALGTALNVGTQDITVGFTPGDPATFLADASVVVQLNVVLVTAKQRQDLGITAATEQHVLLGQVDDSLGTLSGAHSSLLTALEDYETRLTSTFGSGARDMEVRVRYGPEKENWTTWKSSTLPPEDWDDDKVWDATRQTLNNLASRTQDPTNSRWSYVANIPNPGHTNLRWKVIRDPTDKIVISSYPLS